MALVLHPFFSTFTRPTDSSQDTGISAREEGCQTAEQTEQEINYPPLDVLKSQTTIKTPKNSNKIPSVTLKMLSQSKPTSPRSVHLQFVATVAAARPESEPTRIWKNIDAKIDRQTRNAKSKKKSRRMQLRCQYRPRCGERDLKVKRGRRVTRRWEAGLKKESDCGEDVG